MRSYRIWCPDQGETKEAGRLIKANYIEEAVERWAHLEDHESAEYMIVGGSDATVLVFDIEAGTQSTWVVKGESIPSYHARQVGGT